MTPDDETVEAEVDETPADDELTDEILGATPAETPDVEPEPVPVNDRVEAARARIEELLEQGYTRSQLTVSTDASGSPIAVEVA